MAIGRTLAIALHGLDGTLVEVEADVATGLPAFSLVGLPDSSMLQARDRVRGAAAQIGASLPARRLTVNLIPAWMPKHGSGFDLAIAVALLIAQGTVRGTAPASVVHLGELGLDGRLRPVPGVLPAVLAARAAGIGAVVVPTADAPEARLVEGMEVVAAEDLAEVARHYGARVRLRNIAPTLPSPDASRPGDTGGAPDLAPGGSGEGTDFQDVIGQHRARHAAEVAAAGGHHLLMLGPPGSGKSMIAARLPGILPDLRPAESLAVSAIHSVAGAFDAREGLAHRPPYENPHHTASTAAVVGGGSGLARPGAISRAHAGVLFLDEAPEFPSRVLEALREPLETGDITLHRARGVTRYPARFQLVLAANPCPCGRSWGKGKGCRCSPLQRRRYLSRLSGPVLDRIDMRLTVGPVDPHIALHGEDAEPSAAIALRVAAARRRQLDRFADRPWTLNSQIPGSALRGDFAPAAADRRLLRHAVADGRLTLRGHDRVLRVAWTLADLVGADRPTAEHIGTALTLRGGDPT